MKEETHKHTKHVGFVTDGKISETGVKGGGRGAIELRCGFTHAYS